MTLYFGPVRKVPSWQWVGQDVAEYIRQGRSVRFFHDPEEIAEGSTVFWIKCPMGSGGGELIRRKRLRVIFFPVDAFASHQCIVQNAEFIDACQIIAVHAHSMAAYFPGQRVRYIDHYNKYGLGREQRRPVEGFLWVGGYQYYPYIYRYILEQNVLQKLTINILTDLHNLDAVRAANALGKKLGLEADFSTHPSPVNASLIEWSEARQKSLMVSCLGAFDYKDAEDFNQQHKPPTKIQKYLCSQIPCAINQDNPLKGGYGFDVCEIADLDEWLSPAYRSKVEQHGIELSERLSLDSVARAYLRFAAEIS